MKFEEKKKNWMWDNGGGEHLKIWGRKGYARLMPKLQKFMKKCNESVMLVKCLY